MAKKYRRGFSNGTAKKAKAAPMSRGELIGNVVSAMLAAGAQVLLDEYTFDDKMAAVWALKTAILFNKAAGVDTAELESELAKIGAIDD